MAQEHPPAEAGINAGGELRKRQGLQLLSWIGDQVHRLYAKIAVALELVAPYVCAREGRKV